MSAQTSTQLATHLRSLRKVKQRTQTQLDHLVELDQPRIAKIERDPSADQRRLDFEDPERFEVQVVLRELQQPVIARSPKATSSW